MNSSKNKLKTTQYLFQILTDKLGSESEPGRLSVLLGLIDATPSRHKKKEKKILSPIQLSTCLGKVIRLWILPGSCVTNAAHLSVCLCGCEAWVQTQAPGGDWSSSAGTGTGTGTQGVFLFEAAMLSRKQ